MELKDKAISIKGKQYVQVKDRILHLSEAFKDKYSIETNYEYFPERKMWVVKATLILGSQQYTGLAQEVESDNYKDVNFASALENCETSAVGRACAMAGIGVLDSIASADEVNKAVNRGSQFSATSKPYNNTYNGPATQKQIGYARKLGGMTRDTEKTTLAFLESKGASKLDELSGSEISELIEIFNPKK